MQCVNLHRKRSLESEVEPWSCRGKRLCMDVGRQPSESPMETSPSFNTVNQQLQQQMDMVRSTPAPRCCLRCLGGEPGHINHIMGV